MIKRTRVVLYMASVVLYIIIGVSKIYIPYAYAAPSNSFTMGTSSSGGTVYAVGAGIAKIFTENLTGYRFRAMSTGGAVDNVSLMSRGEIQLAINASNTNFMAYQGELRGIPIQKNIRGIASLYPSVFHIVATRSSKITTIEQLKGTKGAVGAMGSATDVYTTHVMDIANLNYKERKDFESIYSDVTSSTDLMKDGHIDWALFPLGVPGSAVLDLALTGKITIIPIDNDFRNRLLTKYPYYIPYQLPGGIYSGFDDPIETAACVITLVVDEKVDEGVVYLLTKVLWENLEKMQRINNNLSWMSLKHPFIGIGVPLHPGAEKYYKEIGLVQ